MIEPAALYREIEALIATVRREGDAQAATWSDCIVRAGFQESASNLAHYLALNCPPRLPIRWPRPEGQVRGMKTGSRRQG
jgi:hypothetical protein